MRQLKMGSENYPDFFDFYSLFLGSLVAPVLESLQLRLVSPAYPHLLSIGSPGYPCLENLGYTYLGVQTAPPQRPADSMDGPNATVISPYEAGGGLLGGLGILVLDKLCQDYVEAHGC